MRLLSKIVPVVLDALAFARNLVRSQGALAAENLFLRKQLTFFIEREQTPRRTDNFTRFTMVTLAKLFEWRNAVIVVKADTLIRWHRKGFRLFWRWKSRPKGRPPVPEELKKLIVKMAIANVSWREERIAHELLVKLGIRVSPRTCESTCRVEITVAAAHTIRLSDGRHSFEITRRPSSPPTS